MHAGLTDSQRELHDAVRSVLAAECPPAVVREAYADPQAWRVPWKTICDLGWLELANAGEGFGAVELCVVLETMGRHAAPFPYLSTVGLAGMGTGEVAAFASTGVGARGIEPEVVLSEGRLTGTAGAVADAERSEVLVVLAEGEDGNYLCRIPTAAVELTPHESLDPSRPLADLHLDAEPESVLPVVLEQAWQRPLTAAAAELVGVASALLDLAVEQAKTRVQFDKPIGSFQGVKHKLADLYVSVEKARSLTYLAAMTLDAGRPAFREAALAKACASETALTAARTCVQVHGAIAQTWEHDTHLFVRRSWQAAAANGDARVLYREVARACI